jgi:hypothetical protein
LGENLRKGVSHRRRGKDVAIAMIWPRSGKLQCREVDIWCRGANGEGFEVLGQKERNTQKRAEEAAGGAFVLREG